MNDAELMMMQTQMMRMMDVLAEMERHPEGDSVHARAQPQELRRVQGGLPQGAHRLGACPSPSPAYSNPCAFDHLESLPHYSLFIPLLLFLLVHMYKRIIKR